MVGSRLHIDVVVPRTTVKGRMRLVSRAELFEVQAETRQALTDAGFPVDASALTALGAGEQWQYELIARVLSKAVRDPRDESRELCSVPDWRECDDDQLAALYQQYKDLAQRLDPLGQGSAVLTQELVAELTACAKKKDADLLISFGSLKLANFILTLVDQLPTSATPMS